MQKWMRLCLSLIVVGMLSGCMESANSVEYSFSAAIEDAAHSNIARMSNHTASYFDYYLPITMGRVTSSESSVVLKSNDTEILLTLDIVNIILNNSLANANNLRLVFDEAKALINVEGKSVDNRGFDQSYKAQLFDLENDEYLIVIQTQASLISAKTNVGLVSQTAYEMLRLARTVVIDRPLILAHYSNAETINYQKANLNMFSQMAPESGTVLDMIEGEESNLLDEDYYEIINDSPTEEEILQD